MKSRPFPPPGGSVFWAVNTRLCSNAKESCAISPLSLARSDLPQVEGASEMERECIFVAHLLSVALAKENPPTIGLILSHLYTTMAAAVLSTLSEEIQADVIYNVARFERDVAQAAKAMVETATPELKALLQKQVFSEIGGVRAVAEILRRVDRSTETAVIEHLNEQDAKLAEAIQSHLVAFSDTAKLTDREIQMLLREVDTKDLAIALKGANEEIRDRIFGNVSERVGTMIKEEMQFSGPVRMTDVEEMQLRVVQAMRQLEDAGEIAAVRCSEEPFL